MNGDKNQHMWDFKANDRTGNRGDLFYCERCKKWSWMAEKPYFKMTWEKYVQMHDSGEIDASEVIGEIVNYRPDGVRIPTTQKHV